MRFRQNAPFFLIVAALAGTLAAQSDEPPAVRLDFNCVSRYVFRGVERAGSSAQAAVEFNRDNFSGGVWTNQPFAGGETREADLHLAYTWQAMDNLKLAASAVQHWFGGVPGGGVDHSLEAGLSATLAPIRGFTPGLAYYRDFRFRSDTAQVSLAHSVALVRWGAFLDLNFYAGRVTGDDWRPDAPGLRARDSYSYWGGAAKLPYRVGAHSVITAGLHYADAAGRSLAGGPFGLSARRNLWITLGVNLDF